MAYQSLVDLPFFQSRSSQLSCLGSGISSLVGGFDSKELKCGAGSSLSTSSGSREAREDGLDLMAVVHQVNRVNDVMGLRSDSNTTYFAPGLSHTR